MKPLTAIKRMVDNNGISRMEASRRMGRNRCYIGNMLARKSMPSTSIFALIANTLGYDVVVEGHGDRFTISPTDKDEGDALFANNAFRRMSEHSGVSQRKASAAIGRDKNRLSSKIAAGNVPSISLFAMLADAFGYKVYVTNGEKRICIQP